MGLLAAPAAKSFRLDLGEGRRRREGREGKGREEQEREMMEREWMEFLWPNSGKQQSQSAPLFSCFGVDG